MSEKPTMPKLSDEEYSKLTRDIIYNWINSGYVNDEDDEDDDDY